MRKALLVLLLIALAVPSPAAVYRCRDKRGVLILTDDPDNFPPGCRSEGRQGETAVPPGERPPSQGVGTPAQGSSPGQQAAPSDRPSDGGDSSGAATPSAGSAGVPPGLNQPNRPAEPPVEEEPRGSAVAPSRSGETAQGGASIASGPELERWMEEARALNREYLEAQTGPPPAAGGPSRLQEIEKRIEAFLDRLDVSTLPPRERAAVEGELPPPQR